MPFSIVNRRRTNSFGSGRIANPGGPTQRRRLNSVHDSRSSENDSKNNLSGSKARVNFNLGDGDSKPKARSESKSPLRSALKSVSKNIPSKTSN